MLETFRNYLTYCGKIVKSGEKFYRPLSENVYIFISYSKSPRVKKRRTLLLIVMKYALITHY